MFLRVGLILLALPAAMVAPGDAVPLTWWTTHCLQKVRPSDSVPGELARSAEVYAARNEFESFQIVLRSDTHDEPDVDVSVSDFRTAGGEVISKENVTVYFEQFLNVEKPSSIEGATGWWPDPLLPRVDRYWRERRNAFPFTLRQGRNQPLSVEIFVPLSARPGQYAGSASISIHGKTQLSVPIKLTVWNFALPSTATLKSSFGLSGISLLKEHRGRYTNDDDLYAITRLYAKAALLHRITTHTGSTVPPRYTLESGSMRLDWSTYDAEVKPFLDGAVMGAGDPLPGARVTSIDVRMPAALETDEQRTAYWTAWADHFKQRGWQDRLFLYLWDEPTKDDFTKLVQKGRAAGRVEPRLRSLVTTAFKKQLAPVVQIWTPLVNCLEPKPGFDDYCGQTPPWNSYAGEIRQGKKVWFYQSCASHGCNTIGQEYFSGWPSYMIDISAPANRVMQWVAWKYRLEGELYYSMNEAYGGGKDPWTSVFLFGGNGDGTLFYPGKRDRIGGSNDIPIESIRLKLIRKGMEDYEYLALLSRMAGVEAADQYAARVVKKPYHWESQPEVFLKVRRDMGEELSRLATATAGNTDAR